MIQTREIQENVERIRENIVRAADKVGRDPNQITLVAVTKTHPVEVIINALEAGLTDIGENRSDEMEEKRRLLEANLATSQQLPIWHMIGHVQSRKSKQIAGCADWVHSLDSYKLAQRLDRAVEGSGRVLKVLVELNLSGEESKYGWPAQHWDSDGAEWKAIIDLINRVTILPNLELCGLMTMAPWVSDERVIRLVFRSARLLRDRLAIEIPTVNWQHLSMGMTDDYEIAIEEGATIIRVGRAIFGTRGKG